MVPDSNSYQNSDTVWQGSIAKESMSSIAIDNTNSIPGYNSICKEKSYIYS